VHTVVVLRDAREADAQVERDAALAERTLERLGQGLVLVGDEVGESLDVVTSAPNERQTEANSEPMTPPPRMITDRGTQSSWSAWSDVMTRPPMSRPGSERAYEPVPSTMFRPVTRSPLTSTVSWPTSVP